MAPENPQSDPWHRHLHHVRAGQLSADTAQTGGMRRSEAISAKSTGSLRIWMGQTEIDGDTASANHHHGDSETAIFVLRGRPAFVFIEDGRERRIETAPGDYVFIPAFVPHREENPNAEEAVVVIARSGQEAIVVNLESLIAPVESSG
jgi:uncharacterized RmlC-like cupin family protein